METAKNNLVLCRIFGYLANILWQSVTEAQSLSPVQLAVDGQDGGVAQEGEGHSGNGVGALQQGSRRHSQIISSRRGAGVLTPGESQCRTLLSVCVKK